MTLPRGFGAGWDECKDCGNPRHGEHYKNCPQITKQGLKTLVLPFQPHHIGTGIWLFINLILVPILMIVVSPIFFVGWFFFGIIGFMVLSIFSDDACKEICNILSKICNGIWKLIPKARHFGYRVKFKE